MFCESQEVDLYEMLGTTKEAVLEINADPFCMENELCASDIIEIIRNQIRAFRMEDRSTGIYADDACYHNKENIWIPVAIMNQIFEQGGISDKASALKQLKQANVLLAIRKLTTRITVGNQSRECYRLKLSALDIPGRVKLVSLGKETK